MEQREVSAEGTWQTLPGPALLKAQFQSWAHQAGLVTLAWGPSPPSGNSKADRYRFEFWLSCKLDVVFFLGFRAALEAYGSSQAGGRIGAVAADLHHSSQQHQILNPLSEARNQTCILMDTSQVCYCWATTGTPHVPF